MKVSTSVIINAPKEEVWSVVSNIENSANVISSIEKLEVLEKPDSGLVGFKWRETRTMFGKTATEVMWVTDVQENTYYDVRAESHGAVYLSKIYLREEGDKTVLTMDFDAQPQTTMSKIMSFLMGFVFKGATKKALHKDLEDIKMSIEGQK